MKAKILLLSLATLLLGACQSENEPTETFYLLQKTESMEERNEFVTNTTGQIYGFSGALPNLCYLMYINGKTPAFVSGAFMPIVLYRFRTSQLSNENNVAFHGGWCIPFPLSFPLLPNIPGRAFHLPEIPG
jgi:hypothetical protein